MKVRKAISDLDLYAPPIEQRAQQDYLLLDFNESTQPPSESIKRALAQYAERGRLQMYPSYGGFLEKLAAYTGARTDQLLITNGSDSAIQVILHALLDPGDEMIFPKPGFAVIESCALTQGAKVISPLFEGPEMRFPFEGIKAAVTPRTRVIVVISPNNPTGTSPEPGDIEALLHSFPDVAVMVDEAYFEFSGHTCLGLLARYDNLVITRTFSKAFALAGLRLGYAISNPGFIRELEKIRIPYDVNSLAVVAAEAALDDPAPWRGYVAEVMLKAKPSVERFLKEHGVFFVPSQTNFLLIRPDSAAEACQFLESHGILVRPQKKPIADMFRMSIGTMPDMQRFMQVFSTYLTRVSPKSARA
ncbi:MAG: histidinol-phosphate aminotransferase family protein [Deltaproteobacteria bacterium]|nr:histidinol-phosphate aminotransferase family protein [Deltaproteobacteria bacterium]